MPKELSEQDLALKYIDDAIEYCDMKIAGMLQRKSVWDKRENYDAVIDYHNRCSKEYAARQLLLDAKKYIQEKEI